MKKLSMYAQIASIILSIVYCWQLFGATDHMHAIRMTLIMLTSEIGLFAFYIYARDYEAIKEKEESIERLKQQLK